MFMDMLSSWVHTTEDGKTSWRFVGLFLGIAYDVLLLWILFKIARIL
jgi:hypothetical protein